VGITGYTIEDFEDKTLIPGLSITYSGGVSTSTSTSLPDLSNHTKSCYNKTSKDEEIKCPRKLT
ncbi:MAG: hypothetical protein ACK544_22295, partial [Microcystis sp.]